jgi:hypothetical protein
MDVDSALIPCSQYRLVAPDERLELHRRRLAGERKPEWCSWGDWMGPLKLKKCHRQYCLLVAARFLSRNIARHFGITESRLSIILSASICRRAIAEVRAMKNWDAADKMAYEWGFKPEDRWWARE